jgi:transposase
MAFNLVPVDRDQEFLMPPSLREWLPEDHMAWFIIDIVDKLDLSAFYHGRREDGWGRAAYDPKMMVAVLLYAYATGVRSSRAIERRLTEDIAFRVIAANNRPDHVTIARFRNTFAEALNGLFGQVLGLCVRADLVDPSVVAVDGTKLEANASTRNNLTAQQLHDIASHVIEDHRRTDEHEDQLYGDRRGDELPPRLVNRTSRREWIHEQLEELKAIQERAPECHKHTLRVNTTDPDSRTMMGPGGYLQGYNAQVVVDRNGMVVAADVSNSGPDAPLFQPMMSAAAHNLALADAAPIGTVLADAGYLSAANLAAEVGEDILMAPANARRLDAVDTFDEQDFEDQKLRYRAALDSTERQTEHRCEVLDRLVAGDLFLREAAAELGMSIAGVWSVKKRYLEHGRAGAKPRSPVARPPRGPTAKQVMKGRLEDPAARELYALRSVLVEPLFAEAKWVRGFRRFSLRGRRGCTLEWMLHMTTHNLRRLKAGLANGIPMLSSTLPNVARG